MCIAPFSILSYELFECPKYILVNSEFFQGILNLNMLFPANKSMNSILN